VTRADDLTVDVDGAIYGCPAVCASYQRDGPAATALFRIGHVSDLDPLKAVERYRNRVRSEGLIAFSEQRLYEDPCASCDAKANCRLCLASVLWHGQDRSGEYRIPYFPCLFVRELTRLRSRMPRQPGIGERIRRYSRESVSVR
jgi:radical SAM protein with 4Fe4S-binding SPASM domain